MAVEITKNYFVSQLSKLVGFLKVKPILGGLYTEVIVQLLLITSPVLEYIALPYCEYGNSITRFIPGIFERGLTLSWCVS